jgi:hypothetical protein
MIAPTDEPREILRPEENAPIDGAESVWDPWLISMYIDALRALERPRLRAPH